jgi:glycosyltransferase involved in cell wall biosynthesis
MGIPKISILIPTRKRPQQLDRVISELTPVLSKEVELLVGIDEDDTSYDINSLQDTEGVKVVRTPKTIYLSNIYNILFEYSRGEIIGYGSDDISFKNMQIFSKMLDVFKERGDILYFFSPGDEPYPLNVPDHAFVTAKSIRSLGFLALPNLEHGYIDHYLGRLYKEINHYHVDTGDYIQHLRASLPFDETYRIKSEERDESGLLPDDRDLKVFTEYSNNYLDIHKKIINSLHI